MGNFNDATSRRTRAIIQIEALLIELSENQSLPDEKLQEARRLLRIISVEMKCFWLTRYRKCLRQGLFLILYWLAKKNK